MGLKLHLISLKVECLSTAGSHALFARLSNRTRLRKSVSLVGLFGMIHKHNDEVMKEKVVWGLVFAITGPVPVNRAAESLTSSW